MRLIEIIRSAYDFDPFRVASVPVNLLGSFKGYLQLEAHSLAGLDRVGQGVLYVA